MTPGLDALADVLRGPVCLVGVGNTLRRDDGVGPWIIGAVREGTAGTGVSLVDAQDVPENFVPSIARAACRNVVFVDAVAAESAPGTVVFGPLAGFAEAAGLSTHKLALSMSGKYLEAAGKTVFLLGIVPAALDFGEGLSPEVAEAAAALRAFIIGAASAGSENRHDR